MNSLRLRHSLYEFPKICTLALTQRLVSVYGVMVKAVNAANEECVVNGEMAR
jgi:hypothetical protein